MLTKNDFWTDLAMADRGVSMVRFLQYRPTEKLKWKRQRMLKKGNQRLIPHG